MSKVVSQLTGKVGKLMQTWERQELKLCSEITKSNSEEGRKWKVLHKRSLAAYVVWVPSVRNISITVKTVVYAVCRFEAKTQI